MGSTKIYKVTGFDTVIFNGVELNQIPPTLEECRWDQIQALVKNGSLGEHFPLNSTKNIKLSSGETLSMHLVSINDGTGSYGRYYPANTADFVSFTATSNNDNLSKWGGTTDWAYNWKDSDVRDKLNNNIWYKLPLNVREAIVRKTHVYHSIKYIESHSGYIDRIDYYNEECSDLLWLPTLAEYTDGDFRADVSSENKAYLPLNNQRPYNKRCTSTIIPAYTDYGFLKENATFDMYGNISASGNLHDLPVIFGFRIG